jgi:hypothetical protein
MQTNLTQNIKRNFHRTLIGLVAALLCAAVATHAFAQAGAPKTKAPPAGTKTTTPAGAGGTATKAPATSSTLSAADIAAKDKILNTPEWKQTFHEFNEWMSAQVIYDADQIQQVRKRMALGISRMTPAQLERFQSDIQEKLAVLNSDQAKQAGTYLTETFAVASPAYARKVRAKLPDVLTMTAAQINQQLDIFAVKHAAALKTQKTFEADRQQSIAYNQAQLAAMRAESDQAMNRASAAAASAGKGGNYTAARDYYPGGVGNDGPFGPGTSYGGFGFGGFGFF